jgi:uncharacterized protein (TIGR04255 family)
LQFAPIPGLTPLHFGLFWHTIRTEFPTSEIKEPILDLASLGSATTTLPIRAWFHDATKVYLVQLQNDRLILNWRKKTDADGIVYPHYDVIRPKFLAILERFSAFLVQEDLAPLAAMICEVTYIDHISDSDIKDVTARGGELFRYWAGGPTVYLREGSTSSFSVTVTMPSQIDSVTLHMQPVRDLSSAAPIQQLRFSALCRPVSNSTDGILDALDRAHDLEVRAFIEFTSEQLQEQWGRKDLR